MDGDASDAADTIASMPTHSVADYEDILARLEALPTAAGAKDALLQEGLKSGYTPPRQMLRDVPKQIADLIPADPMNSAMLQPSKSFRRKFAESGRRRLTERERNLYRATVAPAFQKLHDYIMNTYLPACRESIAARRCRMGRRPMRFTYAGRPPPI